jgi:alpha-mannosidase
MTKNKKDAIIITHTHWDREWYQSLDVYRFRLVELFERLFNIIKNDSHYHSFWLDGQTLPIEDYLKVCPEKEESLKEILRKQKLLIGPWYTAADEFQVSGEATIRNLALGIEESRKYGQENKIGYLADDFGHISQLPQIFAGFDIDNSFFWRGYRLEDISQLENTWEGTDGTRITAICLVQSYSNTNGDNRDDESEFRIESALPVLEKFTASNLLLLMNGVDHALPVHDIPRMIKSLEKRLPKVHIRHGNLQEYLEQIKSKIPVKPTLKGELPFTPGLQSACVGRIKEKLAHRSSECRLVFYAEPLWTFARNYAPNQHLPPHGFLERAWKLLLKNQTHDSIGAHTDAVSQDVMTRYRRISDICEKLIEKAISAFTKNNLSCQKVTDSSVALLYNPCSWKREGPFEVFAEFPAGSLDNGIAAFLGDKRIPCEIIDQSKYRHATFNDYVNPTCLDVRRFRLLLHPGSLSPLSLTPVKLRSTSIEDINLFEASSREASKGTAFHAIADEFGVLDNGVLRMQIHNNGTFDMESKASGEKLSGLGLLVMSHNSGSIYCYMRPLNQPDVSISQGCVGVQENNSLRGTLRFTGEMRVPGGDGNNPEYHVKINMEFSLVRDSDTVSVKVEIENTCPNCRMTAIFPIPESMAHLRAHTPFDITEREPVTEENTVYNGTAHDRNSASRIARFFVQLYGDSSRLVIANSGTGCYWWDGKSVRMTLFEGQNINPMAAELPGELDGAGAAGSYKLNYSLSFLNTGDSLEALRRGYEFNLPVHAAQIFKDEIDMKPMSMMELSEKSWIISCVKPSNNGNGTVVRFWNASSQPQEGWLKVNFPFKRAVKLKLDETFVQDLEINHGKIRIKTKPKEIVTINLSGVKSFMKNHRGRREEKNHAFKG